MPTMATSTLYEVATGYDTLLAESDLNQLYSSTNTSAYHSRLICKPPHVLVGKIIPYHSSHSPLHDKGTLHLSL